MGYAQLLRGVLVTALVSFLTACSGLPSSKSMPTATEAQSEPYEIGVGDTVSIHVWRNPELSQTIVVRPDGNISMPLTGDVVADGKRPEELASEIRVALSELVRNPEVTVMVVNPASKEYRNRVRITGQVEAPQSVAFQPGMTVLDLVLLAGGLTDFAADSRATLNREVNGEYKTYGLDLGELISEGNMKFNHVLQPGDVISVPRKQIFRGEL